MTEFCADIDKLFTELPFEQRFKAARNEGFSSVEFEMPKKIGLESSAIYAPLTG